MLERPSREAWEAWIRSGPTQFYLTELNETREAIKEELAVGKAGTPELMYTNIGLCEGYRRAIEMAREVIPDQKEEDKNGD